jgi:hypothetical protein
VSVTTPPAPYVYQSAPLTTDVSTIKQQMVDYMTAYMPAGWVLRPGSAFDLFLEAVAMQAALQNDVVQQKLDSDFRYFGSLVNLPPIDALPATTTVTFTVQDTNGYTVTGGSTVVGVVDATGNLQGFALDADVVIASGSSTGSGSATAQQAGTICNGLSGSAQLISADPWVIGATMTPAVNGLDAELDGVYLNRLTETLGLLTPIPVLGSNFAVLARAVPGVYRACGVNLLKPGSPYDTTSENDALDKNVTVAVADINGLDPGATIRGNAQTYLNSLRETNFKIWVVAAQYATIDISAMDIYAWAGWDASVGGDVYTRALAALNAALDPATFATDPSGNAARWANDPVVHASDLAAAVLELPGVRYCSLPTFGIHSGTMGTSDVTMGAGSAIPALPLPGTISITVHAGTV